MNLPLTAIHSVLTRPARIRVRNYIVQVIARQGGTPIDYDHPLGDAGLFGPDSVTWKIHADFPGMMSGGICALMLQSLHPLALAGVWDHSNFRSDILGRLRRTTAFVAGTTFAPRQEAEKLIEKVARIHDRVHGYLPDGRPYSANDPELLTWVHTTEMCSFLRGYQAYCRADLPRRFQDQYYFETSRIAKALGARDVPKSAAAVESYFDRIQPQLEFTERSTAVLEVLASLQLPIPGGRLFREAFLGAGAALLPGWAKQLMSRRWRQIRQDRVAAGSLRVSAPLLRAALAEGVAARSCRRMGVDRSRLHRWGDEA